MAITLIAIAETKNLNSLPYRRTLEAERLQIF